LLDRGGKLVLGAVPLLVLLRRVQTRCVRHLVLLRAVLPPSGRLASSNCVLVCLLQGVFLLVPPCQSGSNAAESRLLGLLLCVYGCWQRLRAGTSLVEASQGVRRASLLLVALQLVVRA
jgi:hypothetical protein